MAFFSEAGITAAGPREKMRLCSKCGRSLIETPGQGYCCPVGHGCWLPRKNEEKVIREPLDATYAGGAIVPKGVSKGRKRKKQTSKEQWNSNYVES